MAVHPAGSGLISRCSTARIIMTSSGRAACLQCGTLITSITRRRYCGNACRQAAHRARQSLDARVWAGTAIQRRLIDGYVNATAMCQANGKQWPHYRANDRTAQYLQALSRSLGIPMDLLARSITTGPNDLRGTWIHPRLAVDLARWISPAFAVWMDGWFLEAAAQGQQQPPRRPRRARRRAAPRIEPQAKVGMRERMLATWADIDIELYEEDGDLRHLVAAESMAHLLSHRLTAHLLAAGRLPTWTP